MKYERKYNVLVTFKEFRYIIHFAIASIFPTYENYNAQFPNMSCWWMWQSKRNNQWLDDDDHKYLSIHLSLSLCLFVEKQIVGRMINVVFIIPLFAYLFRVNFVLIQRSFPYVNHFVWNGAWTKPAFSRKSILSVVRNTLFALRICL